MPVVRFSCFVKDTISLPCSLPYNLSPSPGSFNVCSHHPLLSPFQVTRSYLRPAAYLLHSLNDTIHTPVPAPLSCLLSPPALYAFSALSMTPFSLPVPCPLPHPLCPRTPPPPCLSPIVPLPPVHAFHPPLMTPSPSPSLLLVLPLTPTHARFFPLGQRHRSIMPFDPL